MSDIGSESLQLSSSKLCVEHIVSESEMHVGNKRRKVSLSTPVAVESGNPEARLEPVVMKRKRTSGHSFKGKLREETVPEQKGAVRGEDAGSEVDHLINKFKKKCDKRLAKLSQKHKEQLQEFKQIWKKKRSNLKRDYKLELVIMRSIYGEGTTRTNNKLKLLDDRFEKILEEHNLLKDVEFKNLKAEQSDAKVEEEQKKAQWLALAARRSGEPKKDDGPKSLRLYSEEVGREISKSLSTDQQNDLGAAFSQISVLAGVEQLNQLKNFYPQQIVCALPASRKSIPGEIRLVKLNKVVPPEVPETVPIEIVDYASPVELSISTSNKRTDTGVAIGLPDALVNLGKETDEVVGLPLVEQILKPPEQTKASWTPPHCTSLLPRELEDQILCSSISDTIQDIGAQVNPVQEQSTENQNASPFEEAASGHADTVTVAQSDIELHDQGVADASWGEVAVLDSIDIAREEPSDKLHDQDATDLEDQDTPWIEVANSEPVNIVNSVQSNVGALTVQNYEELVPSCNQLPPIEVGRQSHNLERSSTQTAEIADTVVVSHESASQLGGNRDLQSNHFGVGSGSQINPERISSQTAETTETVLLSHESTSQLGGNLELRSNHFGIGSESQVIHESSFEVSTSSHNNVNVSQIVANTVELQHQAGLQLGIAGNLYGSGYQFSNHQVTSCNSPLLYASPLQHELGKISKEIDQLQKSHEDMKSQLRSDCEKEMQEMLAQINSKYDLKHLEAESEFSHKRNRLEKNRNIVLMNKLLAESFSSSFRDLCWPQGILQAAPSRSSSSSMQNQTLVRPPPMAMNHHPVLGQPIASANIQQLLPSHPTRHAPTTPQTPQNAIQQLLLSNPTRHTPVTSSPPQNAPAFSFASSSRPLRPLLINSITPTPNSRFGGNVRSGAPHLQPRAASFMPTPTFPSTFQDRPQHQGNPPAVLNQPSSAPHIPASSCIPQINSITSTPNSCFGGNVRSGAPHLQPHAALFMPTPAFPSTFQHSQPLPPPPSTFQSRPQHQGDPPALLNSAAVNTTTICLSDDDDD